MPDAPTSAPNPFASMMEPGQAPPRPPAAKPTAAPPDQSDAIGDVLKMPGELGSDIADRWHDAHEAIKGDESDILGPTSSDPAAAGRQMIKRSLFGGAPQLAADAANQIMSPLSGASNFLVGRGVEMATGGRVTKRQAGDAAMLLAPLGAELGGERAANAAAKGLGVSRETYEAHAAAARAATGASGARAAAARRLTGSGPGKGKLDPEASTAAAEERLATGAGEPTLLDTMDKRQQRVVRASGARMGSADETLHEHREAVRGDVSARQVQRTEKLSPYHESIEQRVASLTAQRDDLAREKYRAPYAEPVQADDRLFDVLDSRSGNQSVAAARRTAQERMLDDPEAAQQYHEMGALQKYLGDRAAYEENLRKWEESGGGTFAEKPGKAAKEILDNPDVADTAKQAIRKQLGWKAEPKPEPPKMPTVSGGTIDRIRIQMRNLGEAMQSKPATRATGGGVARRAQALNEYLDGVPQLKEARAEYRDYSARIEQLQFDRNISTMRPEEFKRVVGALSPEQRKELIHSVTERLAGALGRSPRTAQSQTDIDVNGYNARENLSALLGPEDANRYLRARKLIDESLKKATFVDPSIGSQTHARGQDAQDVAETGARVGFSLLNGRWHSAGHQIYLFTRRWFSGIGEAEARQIADWAVQQKPVEETLQEIATAAKTGRVPVGAKFPPELRALIGGVGARNMASKPTPDSPEQTPEAPAAPPPARSDPNNVFNKIGSGADPAPTPKDAPQTPPGAEPTDSGEGPDTQRASELIGLQGDDLKAALDVLGVESGGAKGRLVPTAYNPAGGGHGARGIAQWRGDRQQGMGDSLEDQLKHVGEELRSPRYAHVVSQMAAQPTIEGKWDVWLTQFEGLERGGPDYNRDMASLTGRKTSRWGSPSSARSAPGGGEAEPAAAEPADSTYDLSDQ